MPRSRASASYTITARDRTRAGVASARNSIRSLDTLVSRLGINFSILSAAAAAAPLGIVAANVPVIDSYGKLSETLGIAVESVQGFIDASERAGIAQNTLFTSLQRGLRRVSEAANGLGEARGALDELGLSATELERLAPEERIASILDAIRELDDEGDRVRVAAKIFDSEGVSLIRLTGDAVRDATDEMVSMGRALTEIDVSAVEQMNDDMQLLRSRGRSATQVFTAEMAPAISGLVQLITGATDSMGGFRQASRFASDTFIDVVGIIGNGVEGVDNFFSAVGIGLQRLNVLANSIGARFGDEEDLAVLEESQRILREMEDSLFAQTSDETFWSRLERQATEAREESEAAARDIENIRARIANTPLTTGGGTVDNLGNIDRERTAAESGFDSLIATLADQREAIDLQYQDRLDTIERFRTALPERIQDATDAEVRALEARIDALAELDAREEEEANRERETALRPLQANLDQVRAQLESESELIAREATNRLALLEELGQMDLDQRAEINELKIQLEEDTQRRLSQIEATSASDRLSAQANFAARSFGIASSLVSNLGGESRRAQQIAARASQIEALVAGISAAERARNHASLTGGLISGGLAAAASWGATLANVAGIEVALQGGTPGGASGGGGSAGTGTATTFSNNFPEETAPNINITFNFDDEMIDRQVVNDMTLDAIAEGTQNRNLVYDQQNDVYIRNTEGATT